MKILERNKDITSLSNFKISTKAEYYFEINNLGDIDKLFGIVQFAEKKYLKILFVG
jgi:hypothetical protein